MWSKPPYTITLFLSKSNQSVNSVNNQPHFTPTNTILTLRKLLWTYVNTVTKTTPSGGMPMVKDNASSVTSLGH